MPAYSQSHPRSVSQGTAQRGHLKQRGLGLPVDSSGARAIIASRHHTYRYGELGTAVELKKRKPGRTCTSAQQHIFERRLAHLTPHFLSVEGPSHNASGMKGLLVSTTHVGHGPDGTVWGISRASERRKPKKNDASLPLHIPTPVAGCSCSCILCAPNIWTMRLACILRSPFCPHHYLLVLDIMYYPATQPDPTHEGALKQNVDPRTAVVFCVNLFAAVRFGGADEREVA